MERKKAKNLVLVLIAVITLAASQIACDIKVDPSKTIGGQAETALEGSPIDPNE